jgi:ParB/RepB/Spo0J family partition protein
MVDTAAMCPLEAIRTTMARARCRLPARIERMKQSLSTHGQLTPLLAVRAEEGIELIDGFKRLAAAKTLGWTTILVSLRALEAPARWTVMLLINRGPQSMTELEEALVLREMTKLGLQQVQIAQLLEKHRSWVSRRIGLMERLHPELIEAMKIGLLHPGVARRLLSLPPGNQLTIAAAVQQAALGPRDTELLVSLFYKTREPEQRQAMLADPRAALREHHPQTQRPAIDPHLSATGQKAQRMLWVLEAVARQLVSLLEQPISAKDLRILKKDIRAMRPNVDRLAILLGSLAAKKSERDGAKNNATA